MLPLRVVLALLLTVPTSMAFTAAGPLRMVGGRTDDPAAVGFAIYGPARNTTGGLGKAAYTVTNRADTNTNGTLRYGLETFAPANGGAYITRQAGLCGEIVFATNRTIATDNVTLDLGPQPGEDCPGVVITNSGLVVQASNVIVRHVRIRNSSLQPELDNFAITGPGPYSDIVFDHVSGSGAEDGTLDINALGGTIRRVTIQHSLLGRPSNDAGRCGNGIDDDSDTFTDYPADTGCVDARDDDESTAGGQWGTKLALNTSTGSAGCVTELAYYRNVLLGGTDRNISFDSWCESEEARVAFVENVTYDNVYGMRISGKSATSVVRADVVRNLFKRGGDRTGEDVDVDEKLPVEVRVPDNAGLVYVWGFGNRLVDNGAAGFDWADDPTYGSDLTGAETDVFQVTSGGPDSIPLTDCTVADCSQRIDYPSGVYRDYPLAATPDISVLMEEVLENVGASPGCRDPLDRRYTDEVRDGTRAGSYPESQPTLTDLADETCDVGIAFFGQSNVHQGEVGPSPAVTVSADECRNYQARGSSGFSNTGAHTVGSAYLDLQWRSCDDDIRYETGTQYSAFPSFVRYARDTASDTRRFFLMASAVGGASLVTGGGNPGYLGVSAPGYRDHVSWIQQAELRGPHHPKFLWTFVAQGESDATGGVSYADYKAAVLAIAAREGTFGRKVLWWEGVRRNPVQGHWVNFENIVLATRDAIDEHANLYHGPVAWDLQDCDGTHYCGNALSTLGRRWYESWQAAVADNQPPTVDVTASSVSVGWPYGSDGVAPEVSVAATGGLPVTLVATATDPESDSLSYSWAEWESNPDTARTDADTPIELCGGSFDATNVATVEYTPPNVTQTCWVRVLIRDAYQERPVIVKVDVTENIAGYPDALGTDIGLAHPDCATLCPSGRTTSTGGDISTSQSCMTFTSQIDIVADDVTIQCSELTAPSNSYGVRIGKSGNVANRAIVTKNKIHNVGIPQGKCIYATGYGTGATISYNEITDCEDAIHSERSGSGPDPYVIEWNWLHDLRDDGGFDLHQDALTLAAGSNVTVRNNRFGPFVSPNLSATIMIQPTGSCPAMDNIDVIENYITHDGTGHNVLNDRSAGCTCSTDTWFINNVLDSSGVFISLGNPPKDCVPLSSRGGGCTGNTFLVGGAAGC